MSALSAILTVLKCELHSALNISRYFLVRTITQIRQLKSVKLHPISVMQLDETSIKFCSYNAIVCAIRVYIYLYVNLCIGKSSNANNYSYMYNTVVILRGLRTFSILLWDEVVIIRTNKANGIYVDRELIKNCII